MIIFLMLIIIVVAYSLGDLPAGPDRDLLVLVVTTFHWLLGALLILDVDADLLRDLATRLAGHLLALLHLHIPAHLLLPFLGHVLAFVIFEYLAGAGDDGPLHVVALAFPRVLALLHVRRSALCLGVGEFLVLAHFVPHIFAYLLITLLTLKQKIV